MGSGESQIGYLKRGFQEIGKDAVVNSGGAVSLPRTDRSRRRRSEARSPVSRSRRCHLIATVFDPIRFGPIQMGWRVKRKEAVGKIWCFVYMRQQGEE